MRLNLASRPRLMGLKRQVQRGSSDSLSKLSSSFDVSIRSESEFISSSWLGLVLR